MNDKMMLLAALTCALQPAGCEQQPPQQTRAESSRANVAAPTSVDTPPQTSIDRNTLKGGWSPDGEMFALSVEDSTILFEFDMKDHPYTLKGDTIIVDFQDPTLGVQKKRVLKLTRDTLVIEDVQHSARATFIRVRQ